MPVQALKKATEHNPTKQLQDILWTHSRGYLWGYKTNQLLIRQESIHWKTQQLRKRKKVPHIYHIKSNSQANSASHNLFEFLWNCRHSFCNESSSKEFALQCSIYCIKERNCWDFLLESS